MLLEAAQRRTTLGLALRCDGLTRESIAGLLERARRAVASAAPNDLAGAAAAYLGAVEPLAAALVERAPGDGALRAQADALRAELAASAAAGIAMAALPVLADTEGSSAPPARRPAPEPALAALLVLLAPARVMEVAPSLTPAWNGLRAPLSEALREELATLDAQLAYLLGELAPEGLARQQGFS